ncbi:MAG: hypothetical protein K2Y23_11200 [Cyanobacteria bacterium]|nr:hypothetical protein [Cyanobacteriota bacterium]
MSPAELAAALKDPATVAVPAGPSEADFIAGHIPGARFVRYGDYAIDADGLSSELPSIEQLRKVMSAAGISDKSKVVIYGAAIPAARLFFTLDYIGPQCEAAERRPQRLEGERRRDRSRSAAGGRDRHADVEAATRSRRQRRLDQGAPLVGKNDAARRAARFGIHRRRSGMNGAHVKGHLPDAHQLVELAGGE